MKILLVFLTLITAPVFSEGLSLATEKTSPVVLKIESPSVVSTEFFPYKSITEGHLQNLLTKRVTLLPDDTPIIIIYNTQTVTYAFVAQVLHMSPEEFKRELRRNTRGPVDFLNSDSQILRRLSDNTLAIIEDIDEAKRRKGRDIREILVVESTAKKSRGTLDEKSN
jgi:hypothetical protein